jgi:hypothetical protein
LRAPEAYIQWVNKHIGFNPRGQANSDALSDLVVADLRSSCGLLGSALGSGELKQGKNPNVHTKTAERSIDLVIYENTDAPAISVRVSVEHKTVMTAHGKARKNRYGDIIAYSNHMHNHRRDCIAGAIVVINISPKYENPDAFAKGLQRPDFNMEKVVKATVNVFSRIPLRNEPEDPSDQPEALAVILVDYDGVSPGKLVPGPGGSIQYESFIERICTLYERRFSAR